MPSTRTWPVVCAGPCTARPASGWAGAGHRPCQPPRGWAAAAGATDSVAWLARAARQAAPRSPDVAADLLGRAAGLMTPGDPGRDGLLAERASSLMWAGRVADAEAPCRSLLDRDLDPSLEGAVRV